MTHEIASAGYKLPSGQSLPSNGIVSANSGSTSIRFVTNTGSANTAAVSEANEDVMYALTSDAAGNKFVTRYDMNSGPSSSVIGNRRTSTPHAAATSAVTCERVAPSWMRPVR